MYRSWWQRLDNPLVALDSHRGAVTKLRKLSASILFSFSDFLIICFSRCFQKYFLGHLLLPDQYSCQGAMRYIGLRLLCSPGLEIMISSIVVWQGC
jgi:hypothetical protein